MKGMGADFHQHLMASLEEQELLKRVDVHATAVSSANIAHQHHQMLLASVMSMLLL